MDAVPIGDNEYACTKKRKICDKSHLEIFGYCDVNDSNTKTSKNLLLKNNEMYSKFTSSLPIHNNNCDFQNNNMLNDAQIPYSLPNHKHYNPTISDICANGINVYRKNSLKLPFDYSCLNPQVPAKVYEVEKNGSSYLNLPDSLFNKNSNNYLNQNVSNNFATRINAKIPIISESSSNNFYTFSNKGGITPFLNPINHVSSTFYTKCNTLTANPDTSIYNLNEYNDHHPYHNSSNFTSEPSKYLFSNRHNISTSAISRHFPIDKLIPCSGHNKPNEITNNNYYSMVNQSICDGLHSINNTLTNPYPIISHDCSRCFSLYRTHYSCPCPNYKREPDYFVPRHSIINCGRVQTHTSNLVQPLSFDTLPMLSTTSNLPTNLHHSHIPAQQYAVFHLHHHCCLCCLPPIPSFATQPLFAPQHHNFNDMPYTLPLPVCECNRHVTLPLPVQYIHTPSTLPAPTIPPIMFVMNSLNNLNNFSHCHHSNSSTDFSLPVQNNNYDLENESLNINRRSNFNRLIRNIESVDNRGNNENPSQNQHPLPSDISRDTNHINRFSRDLNRVRGEILTRNNANRRSNLINGNRRYRNSDVSSNRRNQFFVQF
ncbi:unnamed protein product, partial [Gordionus sp. m RMFG-2023]